MCGNEVDTSIAYNKYKYTLLFNIIAVSNI